MTDGDDKVLVARNLRVLMLLSRFRDDGIGVTVHELSKALASRGHRITIGAFEIEIAQPEGTEILTLSPSARLWPWTARAIFHNFDIVHHHQSAPLGIALKRCPVPVVSSFHGFPTFEQSHKYTALAERLSFFVSSRGFAPVIVPLRCVQSELEHRHNVSASRIRVIHPGIDLGLFKELHDLPLRSGPRLLYVGDLVRHKRVDLLIQALVRCRRKVSDSGLTIVGDGNDRRSLEELVRKLGLERVVNFVGRLPHSSLPSVYRSSDVYVSASATEVFGLPILEAMACGVPVVASPCAAHIEILSSSGGGLTADPASPEEFSNGILRVYQDRTKYSQSAAAYAAEHSWTKTGALTEAVYAEVLSSKNTPRA